MGCIDENGEVILDNNYEYAEITSENGMLVIKIGDVYRFIRFIKFDL